MTTPFASLRSAKRQMSGGGRFPDSRVVLLGRLPADRSGMSHESSPVTVAGAVSDSHRLPSPRQQGGFYTRRSRSDLQAFGAIASYFGPVTSLPSWERGRPA